MFKDASKFGAGIPPEKAGPSFLSAPRGKRRMPSRKKPDAAACLCEQPLAGGLLTNWVTVQKIRKAAQKILTKWHRRPLRAAAKKRIISWSASAAPASQPCRH